MLRDAPPGIEKTIRQLSGEADRMEGIVQQLLSLARPDDAARAPCSLESVLNNVLSRLGPYAAQRRIGFEQEVEPGVPDVAIYAPQMEQVFINLVRNAIEAAPPDSVIRIKLFRHQADACVSVHDTGSGVTAADAGRVFEPFFSTKPRGVGLGLALSREMVEANGGDIQFQSSPEGTTVTVRLPIEERK
jgi:signal transduction histidine kinase